MLTQMGEQAMDVRVEVDFPQAHGGRLRLASRRVVQAWTAHAPGEVRPVLAAADAAARAGRWVAGFVAYEAAAAFEPAMRTHPAHSALPLAAFFALDPAALEDQQPDVEGEFACGTWRADDGSGRAQEMVRAIHAGIAAGEYYQVNASTRLRAAFSGDPGALYRALAAAQPLGYCARIATPGWEIHSVSPELFFDWDGELIVTRPMKGTAPRFADPGRDAAASEALRTSAKDRAENVMIVDLIRNDLSRIARTGSVRAPSMFEVQALPTVWQMTSSIECRTRAGVTLEQVFAALFPCGSVTGAPKIRAMGAIAALESSPRGVYCGAVGVLRPGGHATFNVAIRTLFLDKAQSQAECGVGSGITIQSSGEAEHAEWMAKRRFLLRGSADFELLETMLLRDGTVWLWPGHCDRLRAAAEHFGFALDEQALESARARLCSERPEGAWRVRLTCARDGSLRTQAFALEPSPAEVDVVLAKTPVRSDEEFLRWKTTARAVYAAHQPPPGSFDTLMWNERGELTEFTRGNVVLEIDGRRLTPPVDSGLLPGVHRALLLRQGEIEETVLRVDDLSRASRLWFVNSVRGRLAARLVPHAG